MHIALLSRAVFGLHGYGGLERHVLELARHLTRNGVRVTIVTMPPTREPDWHEPGIGLQIVEAPRFPLKGIPDRVLNYPRWAQAAGEFIASQPFDLVHAQGFAGWGYARQLARGRARAPLVINPQGMEEFKTTFAKRTAYAPLQLLARQAARQASAVIASDTLTIDDIPRFLRVPPEQVVMIPNGLDVDAARNWVRPDIQQVLVQRLNLRQRLPLLLSVGRLEQNKGFDVLLTALGRIRCALPSKWLWVLAGDGPQRQALQERVRVLKLKEHVLLLGSVDEVTLHNLYELATLFVHPTLFEGSSLVTLEAMAHARPIVGTTVGGIPDKVLSGRNGYLVPPGDIQALADKLLFVLRDTNHLKAMGQTSYQLVRERFDWNVVIHQTIGLYTRILEPGSQHSWVNIGSGAPLLS